MHCTHFADNIAASGIKVIIARSSISDLVLHYLNHHSIAVLKVPSKFELRRLCRVVNVTPLERMGTPTPEEAGWVNVYETVLGQGRGWGGGGEDTNGDDCFEGGLPLQIGSTISSARLMMREFDQIAIAG
jgi:T-complex protein 1 subunit theta